MRKLIQQLESQKKNQRRNAKYLQRLLKTHNSEKKLQKKV